MEWQHFEILRVSASPRAFGHSTVFFELQHCCNALEMAAQAHLSAAQALEMAARVRLCGEWVLEMAAVLLGESRRHNIKEQGACMCMWTDANYQEIVQIP